MLIIYMYNYINYLIIFLISFSDCYKGTFFVVCSIMLNKSRRWIGNTLHPAWHPKVRYKTFRLSPIMRLEDISNKSKKNNASFISVEWQKQNSFLTEDISILLPVVVCFLRSWCAMRIFSISVFQVLIWNTIFYDFLNYLKKRFLYRSDAIAKCLFMPPKYIVGQ